MIVVDALSKQFGQFQAVDEISFEVQRGEVVGFLGPNGAGKSTTMKMLTCYLPPTSGMRRSMVSAFTANHFRCRNRSDICQKALRLTTRCRWRNSSVSSAKSEDIRAQN